MKTPLLALILLCGLLAVAGSGLAQVYSWTDENGVKRFSNRKPEGEVGDLKIEEEIEYDEAAAARRKAAEEERAQKEKDQKEKEFWESMQYLQMQDRMRTEKRLQEAEDEIDYLSEQLEQKDRSRGSGRSYYPYWPTRPCWPDCGAYPPRPPGIEPPDIRPPHVRPPIVKDDAYRQKQRASSMSGSAKRKSGSRGGSKPSSRPPRSTTFPPRLR